jgi:hypothetical protein
MLPKIGDIVECIEMPHDPAPIAPGDKGEVTSINNCGDGEVQIVVNWESGRRLHLIYPVDKFRIIKKSI